MIRYHRPGYGRSSPVQGGGSIQRDAADCRALLAALGVARAHVVGVSYSGAVALQMAVDSRSWVHSLILLEPPPCTSRAPPSSSRPTPSSWEDYHAYGPVAGLDRFLTRVIGPDWRAVIERGLPGAAEQLEQDTGPFFDTDIPALLAWTLGLRTPSDHPSVAAYRGSESGQFFAEARELMLAWLPPPAAPRRTGGATCRP